MKTPLDRTGRAAAICLALIALALLVRLAIFMVDVDRMHLTVIDRPFFRVHSCLSSYTEAVRLSASGANIFDIREYSVRDASGELAPRFIGPIEVDLYQYPPSFLVLPYAAMKAGADYFTIRTIWFFIQVALLLGAMIVLGRWIGGPYAAAVLLTIPLVWLAPTTRVGLQMGNFQLTAFPLAVLAMIAFDRNRPLAGGLALGFAAASKIFPGVLGILLLFDRRWRAVGATVAGAIVVTLLAVAAVGTKPFVDFVQYQLPRIESGEAFFWIENPYNAPINQSIYGLVTKLRVLGVPGTGQAAGSVASSLYALLLVPLAILGTRRLARLRDQGVDGSLLRLRQAQVWLGLLTLASLRSPFVPDAYGLVGTLWLLTLIAAERTRPRDWIGLLLLGVAFSIVLDGGILPKPVPAWIVAGSLTIQLAALAINTWVVAAPHRAQAADAAGASSLPGRAPRVPAY